MGVLRSVGSGASALILGAVAFVAGLLGWGAIAGVIDGILSVHAGVVMPLAVRTGGGVIIGFVAAGYVVSEVGSS